MGELIKLENVVKGLSIRCLCGNLTWYLFTDEDGESTLISEIRCTKCGHFVRVRQAPGKKDDQ